MSDGYARRLRGTASLLVLLSLLGTACGGRGGSAANDLGSMSRIQVADAWLYALMRGDSSVALSYIDARWRNENGAADIRKLAARARREHWRILRHGHEVRGGVGYRLCARQTLLLPDGDKLRSQTRNVAYDWKILITRSVAGWRVLGTRPYGEVNMFNNCER